MAEMLQMTPNSVLLAKLVADHWTKLLPKGHFVECPSLNTLGLVVDCLKHFKLIDVKQEEAATRLLRSALKARQEGTLMDFDKALAELKKIGAVEEAVVEKIIEKVDETFAKADIDFDDDLPFESLRRHHVEPEPDTEVEVVEKRVFVSPQHIISATTSEDSGIGKPKHMQKLAGLGAKKVVVHAREGVEGALELLAGQMPNFAEVIEDVIVQVKAQRRIQRGIKLQPILLLGKPGIGKTRFIKKLATALGAESHVFNMGGSADSIKLRGVSRGWGSARPGEIATKLAAGNTFNPFFLFDEIEKAKRSGHDALHDVHGLLLSYLEPESNTTIEDDYIGCPMNLSGINYVFAANNIEELPDAFLSRIDVYNIPDLTEEQFLNLGRMMVVEIAHEEFGGALKSAPINVISELVKCGNARELRRNTFRAIARAVGEGADVLALDHVKQREAPDTRQSIGFY